MFKRLLKWLTKRPEKENSRKLLKEYKSEIKGNKKQKRSKKNMPNEEVKTEEKVVEQTEEKKVPATETKDETPMEKPAEDKAEQKPEVPAMEEEAQPVEEEVEQPQVVEEQTPSNGVRLEDLVTKDELASRLAALEAKYDAVIKENQDLKDKYENKDFGNFQKQGMLEKNKEANSTFDEYSKQFM